MNLENMTWFLDTNIVIFCLRGKSPSAMRKIMNTPAAAIKIPFQVKAELLHGAAKSSKPVEGRRAVLEFIHPFQLILPSDEILEQYVMIRSELERSGSVISEADLWIADTARDLLSTNFCTKEEKHAIARALDDADFRSPYGRELSKILRHGVGIHHADFPLFPLAIHV